MKHFKGGLSYKSLGSSALSKDFMKAMGLGRPET
jgi:hypothetical protein